MKEGHNSVIEVLKMLNQKSLLYKREERTWAEAPIKPFDKFGRHYRGDGNDKSNGARFPGPESNQSMNGGG